MNVTLCKALIALLPAGALLSGSAVLFFRGKSLSSFLQLIGAAGLVVVVLAHVSEGLQLFPWMHWGARIALVSISISYVLSLVSRYFPQATCFMRLQNPSIDGSVKKAQF